MIDFSQASPLFRALGETSRAVERALLPREPYAASGHRLAHDRSSVGSPFHSRMDLMSTLPLHGSQLDLVPASRSRVSVATPEIQRPSRAVPSRRRPSRQRSSRPISTLQQQVPSRDPLRSFGRMMGATFGFVGDVSHFVADTGIKAVQGVANGIAGATSAVVNAGKTLVKGSLERTADVIQGVGQAVSAPFRWLAGLFG
ncbi:MAG: hypothetical protein VKP72_11590 [bacterium]|nr:hypothetical protein [bacterium]